jgi:hypothetical protein
MRRRWNERLNSCPNLFGRGRGFDPLDYLLDVLPAKHRYFEGFEFSEMRRDVSAWQARENHGE